jgi:hypothetical protein
LLTAASWLAAPAQTAPKADEAPTATVEFFKGYDRGLKLGAATLQKYRQFKDGSCTKTRHLADFNWTSKPSKNVTVAAGQKLRIQSQTDRIEYDQTATCTVLFAFTPQAGKSYRLTQEAVIERGCWVTVTDAETGEVPEDFVEFDWPQCASHM